MTRPPSPGKKALNYAEEQLRVHSVYEDAIKAREELDKCLTDLSELKDRKRALDSSLLDAEMEVVRNEWSKHPDMAVTRMDGHLKQAKAEDSSVRELREMIAKVSGDIDGLEADRTMYETDIKISIARMQELNGYLMYLSVIKITSLSSPESPQNAS